MFHLHLYSPLNSRLRQLRLSRISFLNIFQMIVCLDTNHRLDLLILLEEIYNPCSIYIIIVIMSNSPRFYRILLLYKGRNAIWSLLTSANLTRVSIFVTVYPSYSIFGKLSKYFIILLLLHLLRAFQNLL